ncbi:ureidoglycolate lyase [Anaerotruncus massiliensis (ex Togo et al. 2019)]|uniref:ureidoglycolate lyase n=1 Tax=Anaerotruncus TaxID=244127 RepID=UPI0020835F49|nr:ureidoglycolate lyase [Anaerotruncus massiliensis (ex Togo et al. 2019)]GKH47747.1 hypothetical protein CE91St45_23090 [Oscillospiraceae bacterium]
MTIKAIPIGEFDFTPYGTYYNLKEDAERVSHTKTDAYEDHMTKAPLIDTPGHLGYTIGGAAPCEVRSMEKHAHTEEAIFCMAEPVILCVALPHGGEPPRAEDVRAVLLSPGEAAVMAREVWHDACRGLGKPAGYYYLAKAGERPADWLPVSGGPVALEY